MATGSKKMTGKAMGVLKYLQDEDRIIEYYSESDEAGPDAKAFDATWGGLGLTLGLEQGMTAEQFTQLFDGHWGGERVCKTAYRNVMERDPVTGELGPKIDSETGKAVRELGVRTGAIDITFAVPKGVSELYARASTQAEADAIGRVVFDAAKVAWTEGVEKVARVARVPLPKEAMEGRKPGSNTQRVTADLLCTPVLQFTARPTEATNSRGAPADPHLHVHALTMTACQVDGRWLTADEYSVKSEANAEFRDALFANEVTLGLEALGYKMDYVDPSQNRKGRITYEPAASSPSLRKHWSSNHERVYPLVRDFEERYGRPPTASELDSLMSVTKGAKADKEMDSRPTRERWIEDARAQGLDPFPVSVGAHQRPVAVKDARKELYDRLMAPNGLTRSDATFDGSTIRPAVERLSVGLGLSLSDREAFAAQLVERLVIVRAANDERFVLYTTPAQIASERYITKTRRIKAGATLRAPGEYDIAWALDRQPIKLDKEQATAVKAACSSSGWVHIEGMAGSGKGSALAAVRDAHKRAGTADLVVVVSTAAATAERTGRRLEADRWGSVESIERQVNMGSITPSDRTLFIVDEAAMMDTHRMDQLLRTVGKGRVVLVGDPAQLSPIGAAGWYAESVADHGSVMLTRVHRHVDQRDVRDYGLLRQGRAHRAVENLAMRDRIHVSDDRSERVRLVTADYALHRDHGYSADEVRIVADTSNHEIDTLNRFVQRDRIERGEIKAEGFEVESTEQDRRWTVHEGDSVIFLRSHLERGGEPIKNGTTGYVLNLNTDTGRARVVLDGDRIATVSLSASERTQPIGLAYAQHASKIQGGEVPIVQVMPGRGTTNANSGYSQVTRAQHEAHIYLDHESMGAEPTKTLAEAWSQSIQKRSALSFQNETQRVPDGARESQSGHEAPTKQWFADDHLQAKGERIEGWLKRHYDDDLAHGIVTSPAYPGVVVKLEDLHQAGLDGPAMLRDALDEGSSRSVGDPCATVFARLDAAPERRRGVTEPIPVESRRDLDESLSVQRPFSDHGLDRGGISR